MLYLHHLHYQPIRNSAFLHERQATPFVSLHIHQCILDRLEGAEAVGGGGGPLLNNSSMKL